MTERVEKWVWRSLIAVFILVAIACIAYPVLFVVSAVEMFAHAPDWRFVTNGPISLAEARQSLRLPFPDTAHDIQFSGWGKFMAFEEYLRFEAPVNDCLLFAETVIDDHNRGKPLSVAGKLQPINGQDISLLMHHSSQVPTNWFDPQSIQHGVSNRTGCGHRPQVWVDTDRGIVYYTKTD